MGTKQHRRRQYVLFGRTVNPKVATDRVKHPLPAPTSCRLCSGEVTLVNNAVFYGKEYGWPLAYRCTECGARVGCHPDTDIPLGTLADEQTSKARREAHNAFDPLWQGKTPWHRQEAYRALARVMGVQVAHISHFDAKECHRVVELCRIGALVL